MSNVVDDAIDIYIQIQSTGELIISSIDVEPFVELNTPFTINYTIMNNGAPATIYGVLINANTDNVFFKSFWTDTFTGDKTASYTFQDGTTIDLAIKIQIGVL